MIPDTQEILNWLGALPEMSVYISLAVSSVIENVFPPWPGDTVTVVGGFLIARGKAGFAYSMVALVIGNLIGAYIMYFAGELLLAVARRIHARMRGPGFVKGWLEEITSIESMEKARVWFERWGVYYILVSRFSAGVRFFVSIVAGISRMNLVLFTVTFTIGVLIWNTLLLWGGYQLGENWNRITEWLKIYNIVVISIICLCVVVFAWWKWARKKKHVAESLGEAEQSNESSKN